MNGFVADYLQHIIPVSFVLRTGDKEQRIGKENPRFTVDLKKDIHQILISKGVNNELPLNRVV